MRFLGFRLGLGFRLWLAIELGRTDAPVVVQSRLRDQRETSSDTRRNQFVLVLVDNVVPLCAKIFGRNTRRRVAHRVQWRNCQGVDSWGSEASVVDRTRRPTGLA